MQHPLNSASSLQGTRGGQSNQTADELSFAQIWRERAPLRHTADKVETWDKRIAETPGNYGPSEYSKAFLQLAQLDEDDSVFDMGCGAGSLAIPCACAGHPVTAADFSDGMLAQLKANMQEHGLAASAIAQVKLSWEDDWQAAGIAPKSHDVAFASRSIITDDLADSIVKLTNTARRKVCITVVPGNSPRCHVGMLRDIGLSPTGHQDASFAFGVAQELGLLPEVRYLSSERPEAFATPRAAFDKYRAMLSLTRENPQGADCAAAEARIKKWLDEHLRQVPLGSLDAKTRASVTRDLIGGTKLSAQASHPPASTALTGNAAKCDPDPGTLVWMPDKKRMVTWAFISWNTPDTLL